MPINIRAARPADITTLAEFNRRMAWETEGKTLQADVVARGVAAVLEDPAKGFYLVAERDSEIVGQLAITREWSDWRNAWFWWIQSVYVRADARRQGVFRALYRAVAQQAQSEGNVIGLRLYVEEHNHTAQETYRQLGMERLPFLLLQSVQ